MPAILVHTSPMAGLDDLTDEERAAIMMALRQTIDRDRYPLSPRLKPFKSALAKLDPARKTRVEHPPLPEALAARGGPRGEAVIGWGHPALERQRCKPLKLNCTALARSLVCSTSF